jgi:hypothetical protein
MEPPAPGAFHNPIQPASLAAAAELTAGRRTAQPARVACGTAVPFGSRQARDQRLP